MMETWTQAESVGLIVFVGDDRCVVGSTPASLGIVRMGSDCKHQVQRISHDGERADRFAYQSPI